MLSQGIRLAMFLTAASVLCGPNALGALHGKELREDDPEIRGYLQKTVPPVSPRPRPPSQEESNLVVAMLEKGDRYEQEEAVWLLARWGGPLAVPAVLKACLRDRAEVRAQAASSVGLLADLLDGEQKAAAAQELKALLDDKDRRVALAALRSLGDIKAFDDPGIFAGYVGSPDTEFALAALRALGESGDAANFPHVRPGLASEDKAVALAAIQATGRLGDAALAEHVAGKLESDSPAERAAAIRAITSLNATERLPAIHALLGHAHGSTRREALIAVAHLGGAEYEATYLAHTQDADHTVRRAAARAIGRFRLERGLDRLYALFADPHHYVREDAVDAMLAISNETVVELAAKGLTSATATVRECSSQTLGRLKSDANLDAHIQLLKDEHLPARRWAAWGLGQIGRKEATEALNACAFKAGQDQHTMACAMMSLGKLGYTGALPRMRALAADKPSMAGAGAPVPLRVAAVRAIGFLRSEADVGLLVGRLNDYVGMFPELPVVRFEAAVALGRIGSQQGLEMLTTHMNMGGAGTYWERDDIRAACRWSIAQITGQEPPLELPQRYAPWPEAFIRPAKSRAP